MQKINEEIARTAEAMAKDKSSRKETMSMEKRKVNGFSIRRTDQ
jgi:hypothetical protein